MFRTRPSRFALACVALWVVVLVLSLLVIQNTWALSTLAVQALAVAQIVTEVVLGMLILIQLPRALRWQPRRNSRPSAEVLAERQRMAQALHDGIGSQLINTMGLLAPQVSAQSPALRALEQCMLDLRLMVDSMHSDTDSLTDRLAQLRHRIQPLLDQRGIQMAWQVDLADGADMPDAGHTQHLVSIVQEALSNVLQHAQATQVAVRLRRDAEQGAWCLAICDNGRGLPQAAMASRAPSSGFGLGGMRARALQMGGVLELIRPDEGGTCIRVVLPVHCGPHPMRTEQRSASHPPDGD